MWTAALRRFAGLFVLVSAITVAGALVFGVALGADALRSLSLAFYLMGSFLLVAGFFVGNRGPVRIRGGERGAYMFFGSRLGQSGGARGEHQPLGNLRRARIRAHPCGRRCRQSLRRRLS
jgi:hypothetical protein